MKIIAKYYLTLFFVAFIGMGSSFFFAFDVQRSESAALQANAQMQAVERRQPAIELDATVAENLVDSPICFQDEKNCDSTYSGTQGE